MPKALFIGIHRPNRSPSQRFRFEQYLSYLEENGWDCEVSYIIKEKWDVPFYAKGHYFTKLQVLLYSFFYRLIELTKISKYDVVLIQREAIMIGTSFFERQITKRAKTIFDFDDAIWLKNVSGGNAKLNWLKRPSKTNEILECSDLVLSGNPYLKAYADKYNSNVKIFPTSIDMNWHKRQTSKLDRNDNVVCIGWTGSTTTIKHFEIAIPVLLRIKEKYGDRIHFKVIGDESYSNEKLGVIGDSWKLESEISDLQDFDIGIMPLIDDEWSKGKCGLKILQYMALEIPAVVSPVGVNRQIVEDGVDGYFADSQDQWFDCIDQLIVDKNLRNEMGQKARKKVEAEYSVQSLKGEYLKYFNELAAL